MLNSITIMGRLTRDPELRRTGNGIAVASFTLAVDRDFATKDSGERETDFIDCVAWRQTGEFVSKYFAKGRMAVVSGRLQIRNWTDKDGNKRRSAEIIAESVYFGDSKPKDAGGAASANPSQYTALQSPMPPQGNGAAFGNAFPYPQYGAPQNNGVSGASPAYPQYGSANMAAPQYPTQVPPTGFELLQDDGDDQLPF
ncbi:MAG TPA: single-stranded DNA-binding protein [Candidatus Faecousia intestinigallinarum]|nr:single-stranded DNA-binding protein [Candidatus Faecousia intestinigallinarum]